jgi:hypothetical protein
MMEADTTKEPTKLAAEYVASYRFMQLVKNNKPMKPDAAAKAKKR